MANKPLPCINTLRQLFTYDPNSGIFHHNPDRPRDTFVSDSRYRMWLSRFAGKIAGGADLRGYIRIRFSLRGQLVTFYAHRIAYSWCSDELLCDLEIDHINGNKTDNRIANLRKATRSENCKNTVGRPGVTGMRGVTERPNGIYEAKIRMGGKQVHLGRFGSANDARKAYVDAAEGTGRTRRHIGEKG